MSVLPGESKTQNSDKNHRMALNLLCTLKTLLQQLIIRNSKTKRLKYLVTNGITLKIWMTAIFVLALICAIILMFSDFLKSKETVKEKRKIDLNALL